MLELLKKDIKPRDIMTRKAFENAIVLTMALGGSTNAVLHLIAMAKSVHWQRRKKGEGPGMALCPRLTPPCAHSIQLAPCLLNDTLPLQYLAVSSSRCLTRSLPSPPSPGLFRSAGVDLHLDDFQRISDRTPFIADLKPSGKYVMEDVHKVGGTPAVLKYLHSKGLIHGDCMTVTGEWLSDDSTKITGMRSDFPQGSLRLFSWYHLNSLHGSVQAVPRMCVCVQARPWLRTWPRCLSSGLASRSSCPWRPPSRRPATSRSCEFAAAACKCLNTRGTQVILGYGYLSGLLGTEVASALPPVYLTRVQASQRKVIPLSHRSTPPSL